MKGLGARPLQGEPAESGRGTAASPASYTVKGGRGAAWSVMLGDVVICKKRTREDAQADAKSRNARRAIEPVLPSGLELGLWAPTLADQGFAPFLLPDELERFQAHDRAISRLHIAHLITTAAHVSAREKLAKQIKKALRRPLPAKREAVVPHAAQTEAKQSGITSILQPSQHPGQGDETL